MATILDLAELSDIVYLGTPPAPANAEWAALQADGWNFVESNISMNSSNLALEKSYASDGYFADVFHNSITGEIVIADRGTDPTSLKDLLTDFNLATGQDTKAETDANNFAVQAANQLKFSNPSATIIETGHSLGGSEAQAADAWLVDNGTLPNSSVSAVTFNAPGIAANFAPLNAPGSYTALNLLKINGSDDGDDIGFDESHLAKPKALICKPLKAAIRGR